MARVGKNYVLDEILYIQNLFDKGLTVEEIKKLTERSKAGLRAKFPKTPSSKEDAGTSSRSVRQYRDVAEIYEAFNELYPSDPLAAEEDVLARIEKYRKKVLSGNLDD